MTGAPIGPPRRSRPHPFRSHGSGCPEPGFTSIVGAPVGRTSVSEISAWRCCGSWENRVDRSAAIRAPRPPSVDWPPCGSIFATAGRRRSLLPAGTLRAPRRAQLRCVFRVKAWPFSVAALVWIPTVPPRSGTALPSSPCDERCVPRPLQQAPPSSVVSAILDRRADRRSSRSRSPSSQPPGFRLRAGAIVAT